MVRVPANSARVKERSGQFPSLKTNGWQWNFRLPTRYPEVAAIIDAGEYESGFSYEKGVFFRATELGEPWAVPLDKRDFFSVESGPVTYNGEKVGVNGTAGKNRDIDFWHWALGLDGSLIKERDVITDADVFFADFLRCVREGLPFSSALRARTKRSGAVIFGKDKDAVPYVPLKTWNSPAPDSFNTGLVVVPVWWMEDRTDPKMLAFKAPRGPFLGKSDFFEDQGRFGIRRDEDIIYFDHLRRNGRTLEATVLDHSLRFYEGRGRYEGQVMKVVTRDEALLDVHPHAKDPGKSIELEVVDDKSEPKLVAAGFIPTWLKAEIKQEVRLKIYKVIIRDKKTKKVKEERYYIPYAGEDVWLNKDWITQDDYDLAEGDEVELEMENNMIFALLTDSGQRIPFIINWLWEKDDFILDGTTSSRVKVEGSHRVLEQRATTPAVPGVQVEKLTVTRALGEYLRAFPRKLPPLHFCVLVEKGHLGKKKGGKVLFMVEKPDATATNHPRFTEREWEIVKRIAHVRSGGCVVNDAAREEAERVTEEAKTLEKAAKKDIFELDQLEEAFEAYLEAIMLDPTNDQRLEDARELRKDIVDRKRHLALRVEHWQWLRETFAEFDVSGAMKVAGKLHKYLGSVEHNPRSIVYFVEVLESLARDEEVFRKVFESLPYVLSIESGRGTSKRLMKALNPLHRSPGLEHTAIWILNNPPKGSEDSFENKRSNINVKRRENFHLDWDNMPERRTVPIGSMAVEGPSLEEVQAKAEAEQKVAEKAKRDQGKEAARLKREQESAEAAQAKTEAAQAKAAAREKLEQEKEAARLKREQEKADKAAADKAEAERMAALKARDDASAAAHGEFLRAQLLREYGVVPQTSDKKKETAPVQPKKKKAKEETPAGSNGVAAVIAEGQRLVSDYRSISLTSEQARPLALELILRVTKARAQSGLSERQEEQLGRILWTLREIKRVSALR
ncbi:MAG: hypothetical protein ABH823_02530 [bacterium]